MLFTDSVGFWLVWHIYRQNLSVVSFGSWMFAKSPVSTVSSLEKKVIQIHSVRIKLYYILWLLTLLKWMLTKSLKYFKAIVVRELSMHFFFLQRFTFICFCFFWSLCPGGVIVKTKALEYQFVIDSDLTVWLKYIFHTMLFLNIYRMFYAWTFRILKMAWTYYKIDPLISI